MQNSPLSEKEKLQILQYVSENGKQWSLNGHWNEVRKLHMEYQTCL